MIEHRMSNSARVDAEGRPITLEQRGNAWPRLRPSRSELHVPDAVLDDLRERLARVRWPDEAPAPAGSTAPTSGYMRDLVEHWRDGFDWRAQEAQLNALPQFRVELGGIDLHFIHEPGVGPDPMPLLLVTRLARLGRGSSTS